MDEFYIQALYVVFGLYVLLLSTAAIFDIWKFIIPNAVVVGLVALFIGTALFLPLDVDWLSHFGAAAAVFASGAVLFYFNKLGGGDVKLLTAVALWAGLESLPELLIYIALAGGALAIVLKLFRRILMGLLVSRPDTAKITLPRVLLDGEAVPYALAIAPCSIFLGTTLPHLGAYL